MDTTLTANTMPRFSALGPAARTAAALAAAGGGACWLWLAALGAQPGLLGSLLCAGPLLATAGLSLTSQADRNQYLARLVAAALMLPVLLMMWAISHDVALPVWGETASVFGFLLLHGAGFALLIWQLASTTTRIEAQATVTPVAGGVLAARLQALVQQLDRQGAPWRLSRGETADEWHIDSQRAFPQGDDRDGQPLQPRFHRVLLKLSTARHEVQVIERLGVNGDAPKDADEASMRDLSDELIDAARPQASRVWTRTWQTTLIQPPRLAAVRLHLMGGHAQAESAAAADPEGLLTVLAALVTRSGWAWQPRMKPRP